MKHSFKWKKQSVLWSFGIRDYVEFCDNVVVFGAYEEDVIINFVQSSLILCNSTIVVILVPMDFKSGLINILIKQERDLRTLIIALKAICRSDEVWVCLDRNGNGNYYSGRYCIDLSMGEERHIVEIVEGSYPRKIEKLRDHGEDIKYCILERWHWGMSYHQIDAKRFEIGIERQAEILKKIEEKRSQIECLIDVLGEMEIKNVSFDFKVAGDKLTFIDWDTEKDSFAIKRLTGK